MRKYALIMHKNAQKMPKEEYIFIITYGAVRRK